MTEPRDTAGKRDAYVVVFDICSSTSMLEDLILNGKEEAMQDLLIHMREFLERYEDEPPFQAYKFIGDGWILLFPSQTIGEELIRFLERLANFYLEQFEWFLQPELSRVPKLQGLTFGIDRGPVSSFEMKGQIEYIGRAINVASRLQAAIKGLTDDSPFKVLLSNTAYNSLGIERLRPTVKRGVSLRNVQGEADQLCFLVNLEVLHAGVDPAPPKDSGTANQPTPMAHAFDRSRLRALLSDFRTTASRPDLVGLADRIELEILEGGATTLSPKTALQLAKWCDTNGSLYRQGKPIAQEISKLLYGVVLERTMKFR
jgi:class 3 adenylate cyclase